MHINVIHACNQYTFVCVCAKVEGAVADITRSTSWQINYANINEIDVYEF